MRGKEKNHSIRHDAAAESRTRPAGKASTTRPRKVRLVDCLSLGLPSSWMRGFKDVNLRDYKTPSRITVWIARWGTRRASSRMCHRRRRSRRRDTIFCNSFEESHHLWAN